MSTSNVKYFSKGMTFFRYKKRTGKTGSFFITDYHYMAVFYLCGNTSISLRIYLFNIAKSVELTLPSAFTSALSVLMLIPDLKIYLFNATASVELTFPSPLQSP